MGEIEVGVACSTHGEMTDEYTILIAKSEEYRSDRRPRCEDNIKVDLREIWCEVVEWTHPAQHKDQWLLL
jgi:hypothetical protein